MTDEEKKVLAVYLSGGVTPVSLQLIRQFTEAGHNAALWVATSDEATQVRAAGGLPVYGDVTNPVIAKDNLVIADATVVINLTPLLFATPPLIKQDWAEAGERVLAETQALVSAVAETETVEQFVHMSYTFLYEESEEPVDGDGALRHSGVSEFVDAALAADKAAQGAGACVLRVGYMFGDAAGDPIFDVETRLKRTLTPTYFGPAEAVANWVHSGEVAQAVAAVVEQGTTEKAYNLTMNDSMSVHGFVSLLASKLGLSLPGTVPGPIGRTIVGKEAAAVLRLASKASNESAVSDLGWQPRFNSVDDALEDVLLTWRTRV